MSVARRAAALGLYVLSVTNTPSSWRVTSSLEIESPRIKTALGLHPQVAHLRKSELDLFESLLPNTRYVGEIGLDGDPDSRKHWDDQVSVFRSILHLCADNGGRIVSLHSRRAVSEVLDEVQLRANAGLFVLHWFTGTYRELERAISLGCWFSVGPAMMRSEKGKALVSRMPRERVLTESDGPFAKIEGRRASPWDVDLAISGIGLSWNETQEATRRLVMENFRRLVSEARTPR